MNSIFFVSMLKIPCIPFVYLILFYIFCIVGLNYLREVPNKDPLGDYRYNCSLCSQSAHLTEMVRHLIGRKHRQKYVVRKMECKGDYYWFCQHIGHSHCSNLSL